MSVKLDREDGLAGGSALVSEYSGFINLPPPPFPKLMIGLAAHLALVWFVFARVDPAAAECQKPNCCLKEALPAPRPASAPVCSSKHHDS